MNPEIIELLVMIKFLLIMIIVILGILAMPLCGLWYIAERNSDRMGQLCKHLSKSPIDVNIKTNVLTFDAKDAEPTNIVCDARR